MHISDFNILKSDATWKTYLWTMPINWHTKLMVQTHRHSLDISVSEEWCVVQALWMLAALAAAAAAVKHEDEMVVVAVASVDGRWNGLQVRRSACGYERQLVSERAEAGPMMQTCWDGWLQQQQRLAQLRPASHPVGRWCDTGPRPDHPHHHQSCNCQQPLPL